MCLVNDNSDKTDVAHTAALTAPLLTTVGWLIVSYNACCSLSSIRYVSQWTYHTLQELIWCFHFVTQISAVGIHIMFYVYKVMVWYDMVWYGIVGYNVRSTHYRSFRGRYSQPVTGLVQKLGLNQIKMWQSYDTRNLNNNKQQKTKHIQTKLHLMKLKPGLCVFLCCPARKWIGTILQLPRPCLLYTSPSPRD